MNLVFNINQDKKFKEKHRDTKNKFLEIMLHRHFAGQ